MDSMINEEMSTRVITQMSCFFLNLIEYALTLVEY